MGVFLFYTAPLIQLFIIYIKFNTKLLTLNILKSEWFSKKHWNKLENLSRGTTFWTKNCAQCFQEPLISFSRKFFNQIKFFIFIKKIVNYILYHGRLLIYSQWTKYWYFKYLYCLKINRLVLIKDRHFVSFCLG